MLLRLFWRSRMIVPDAPTSLPAAINLVSQLVHYVLYFGVILVAFLGWANAPSRGWPVKLFGFIPLPPIMPKGSDLGHRLGDVHHLLATALCTSSVSTLRRLCTTRSKSRTGFYSE